MTNTTPVWSDEQIEDEITTDFRALDSDWCFEIECLVKRQRDAWQADHDALRQQLKEERDANRISDAELTGDLEQAQNEIAKLRTQLADLEAESEARQQLANIHGRKMLEFAAEVERLRAQVAEAGEWEPVPDGLHYIDGAWDIEGHIEASLGGSLLSIHNGTNAIQLDPQQYRLCRRHCRDRGMAG